MKEQTTAKFELLKNQDILYDLWLKDLTSNSILKGNSGEEIKRLSVTLFHEFIKLLQTNSAVKPDVKEFGDMKTILEAFSKTMASKGQSSTAVTMYIHSLKFVLLKFLQSNYDFSIEFLIEEIMELHNILDKMSLYTFEYFVKEREKIIQMQQEDMLELSTPVIKAWNEILIVPLIGTLDSKRTQIVMEKLLDAIIDTSSRIAILDITGVPTVDTYVANHLINTATAARLLGAEIIITGISPGIAQIMVDLGIDLSGIITQALMEDGFKLALERCNYKILKVKNP